MADLSGVRLERVDTIDKAMEMMRWLGERHETNAIAFDIETGELPGNPTDDALSPYHGRIRLAQIGDQYTGWAIPWDEWSGVFYEAMDKFEGNIITHNIAFEAKWMGVKSRFKFPWERAHDTMIQAHIIDPLGPGGLKPLTSKHVDRRAAGLQSMLDQSMAKNGWTWGTVPTTLREYWAYGALDTVLTTRLWDKFNSDCGPGGKYAAVYDLEMAVRRVITEMEMNGTRVDVEYCERKFNELHGYAESMKQWGMNTYSQPDKKKRSITSNTDLVRIFTDLGAEWLDEERTPTGNNQMNKAVLKRFMNSYAGGQVAYLAEQVLSMRKASKLADTYFANFLHHNIDGVLHPNIRTLAARTSRMSITQPALQTLGKSERTVRDAFIARSEDECLITSDLDQVEFRLFANMSEDPQLIALFNQADADAAAGDPNGDSFTYIMRDLYNNPALTKKSPQRKLIKGYIYGRLYGAGVAKQALTAGVPESQMREVATAFDRNYPGASEFTKRVEDEGMRRYREEGQGYIMTKTGRRLPCDEGKGYTLVNYLIQGSAAEIFKQNLLKCDAAGLTANMVVPVHDEIVCSVPKSDVDEYKTTLRECMTTSEGWGVPLTAGCDGPGARWGDLIE